MTIYLRKIDSPLDWLTPDYSKFIWLSAGEIPANPLSRDMKTGTKENCLSVWELTGGSDHLEDVIAALAANKSGFEDFNYVLIDQDFLDMLKIEIDDKTEGDTPNAELNQKWHRELRHLSSEKLLALTRLIIEHKRIGERVLVKTVLEMVREAVALDKLDTAKMKDRIKKKL